MDTTFAGANVRYAAGGRGADGPDPGSTAPAVVLVHGAGMDRTIWQLQTRWLAHHGFRPIAVDLPGHGGSDGPPLGSIPDLADWIASFVDHLGVGPAHLVGHSMGALAVLETAARHPQAAASLIMLGVSASMPVHPDLLAAAAHDDPVAGRLITSWGIGSQAHQGPHAVPGMWLVGGSNALIARSPAGSLSADLLACAAHQGALEAAARVTCPATFILGSQDKMTPARAAAPLAEAIADSTTTVLPGVGHTMMIESPAEVRQALHAALTRAEAARQKASRQQ
ncbi:MAG: alpha/beta hydrolase [Actinomycetia bacterium]|nr:alpha/beta hydrolase [Actinomycetes bacterium]